MSPAFPTNGVCQAAAAEDRRWPGPAGRRIALPAAVPLILSVTWLLWWAATPACALASASGSGSLRDTSAGWPGWDQLRRVMALRDYNTRVVVLGTTVLGLAAGTIGTFMLLRKRALTGDAISHATLPGIGMAFVVMTAVGGTGKSLPGLLFGGLIAGVLAVGLILLIRSGTRLKEDAALGIVLSVFFGLGVAILGVIQKMDTGHAAGLESFIYGKTASMLAADAKLILLAAALVVLVCGLLFKEFTLLCFDQEFAGAQGWPILWLDAAVMGLVLVVTLIGLQAVGLILVIALLVIPPASARFWTHRLGVMVAVSAGIGGLSGFLGAGLSALVPRLPAGAVIVVVASALFAVSMVFGPARGLSVGLVDRVRLTRKVARQNLLRALYELSEPAPAAAELGRPPGAVPFASLLAQRSWSGRQLRRSIATARRSGLVRTDTARRCRLTERGMCAARRFVRNHRLWELYLITHADIAPGHVDRDADQVEHVLGPEMAAKLEALLAAESPELAVPPSPHALLRPAPPGDPRA